VFTSESLLTTLKKSHIPLYKIDACAQLHSLSDKSPKRLSDEYWKKEVVKGSFSTFRKMLTFTLINQDTEVKK